MSSPLATPPHLPPPPTVSPPPAPPRPHPRYWLHLLLFAATFVSAMLASILPELEGGTAMGMAQTLIDRPQRLLDGLPFALTLMTILLAHEMGHFLAARRYRVEQTLPYFIPAPTIFGTMGAIILMRSQPPDRPALLKVAVMGPLWGLVFALPALAWGLSHSTVPPDGFIRGDTYVLGSSLAFEALRAAFAPAGPLLDLHPVAVAGWVGLFVTSLNLIPAAQLDGGHVAYALFGRRQETVSLIVVSGLMALGMFLTLGTSGVGRGAVWLLWSLFLFILGLRHPPVHDETVRLGLGQKALGYVALLIFVLTFTPVPVQPITTWDANEGGGVDQSAPRDEAPGPAHPAEEFRL